MFFDEIEQWEKETNSVVFFQGDKGVAFHLTNDNDNQPALVIMFEDDSPTNGIVLLEEQLKRLKAHLMFNETVLN